MRPLMIPCEGINRNCALRGIYAYFCSRNRQHEDKELDTQQRNVTPHEFHFLGIAPWSWADIWNVVGADADLMLNSAMRLKRQAVRHRYAVLTYAPTYWPKEGICSGYIDFSIKLCRNPLRSVLQRLQYSQPTVFSLQRLLSMLPMESQSNQPTNFLAAEFDGSICE